MTDFVRLLVRAGAGGRGKVSFRREKYVIKGGPDGGDGGDGGNIIIRGDRSLATLKDFAGKVLLESDKGQGGGKRKKSGARGEDLVVRVPIGTHIQVYGENREARQRRMAVGFNGLMRRKDVRFRTYEIEWSSDDDSSAQRVVSSGQLADDVLLEPLSGEPLDATLQGNPAAAVAQSVESNDQGVSVITIEADGQEFVLCQGGFGGRGNVFFKSSVRTTPRLAQWGTLGELRLITLELKLLADVGMVGFPNAGKSTLLSVLTKARPKVAAYPFTTLEPNLGIMQVGEGDDRREMVLADLPGLIEGASEGKGLGHAFLRHIENCRALLFMVYLTEEEAYADTTAAHKAQLLWQQYETLRGELHARHPDLLNKPAVIAFTKADLYAEELVAAAQALFAQRAGVQPVALSSVLGQGVRELSKEIADTLVIAE